MIRNILCLLLAIAPTVAVACNVKLLNNSDVDLTLSLSESRSVLIAPSQFVTVNYSELQFIEFGAVEHEYPMDNLKQILCPPKPGKVIEVEARKDGQLWLRCSERNTPFPIAPKRMRDLTIIERSRNFKQDMWKG